jgi:hypothetical protein
MKRTQFPVLLLSALLMCRTLSAQTTLSDYQRLRNSEPFKLYISGVGSGLAWANFYLRQEHRDSLYCQPPDLVLQQANYLQILDSAVEHVPAGTPPETRLENLLLSSLVTMFPCNSQHQTEASMVEAATSKVLRFEPATLGSGDEQEVTPGCVGILDVTRKLSWEDPKNCWSGQEVDATFNTIESIDYDIWPNGTALMIRMRHFKRPLLLGINTIAAIKVFRQVRKYSSSAIQRCAIGASTAPGQATRTPVACEKWAEQ